MPRTPVKPRCVLAALLFGGCAVVDDGAVELSWTFRPASSSLPDKFVGCNANNEPGTHPIEAIELDWDVEGHQGSRQWPCVSSTGATRFELPPGQAVLTVTPVCADGIAVDPVSFIAPAPYQRDVARGDTVSLGAVEIVLQVSSCLEQACICHGP